MNYGGNTMLLHAQDDVIAHTIFTFPGYAEMLN